VSLAQCFLLNVTLTEFYRDFPKALWMCTITQTILFIPVGIVIYKFTGRQYMTAPAFGALDKHNKMIAFSLMVPTIIVLGALFASITARFVLFRVFRNSKHLYNHTVKGWLTWIGMLSKLRTLFPHEPKTDAAKGLIWVMAFLVSQLVPFFSSRKSLPMSVLAE
jgi:hypothetical protein